MCLKCVFSPGSIHTTKEKFKNASLFQQLGSSSTIRHENGAFRKCPWRRRLFIFGTETILKTVASHYSRDFPARVYSKHKSKHITSDSWVFQIPDPGKCAPKININLVREKPWERGCENFWCVFRVKFLGCGVDVWLQGNLASWQIARARLESSV